jgi:hypothetical protein
LFDLIILFAMNFRNFLRFQIQKTGRAKTGRRNDESRASSFVRADATVASRQLARGCSIAEVDAENLFRFSPAYCRKSKISKHIVTQKLFRLGICENSEDYKKRL